MTKSKVVHLSTVHPAHDTRILYRECTSLSEKGYDVTLFICNDQPITHPGVTIINFLPPRNRIERMTLTAFYFLKKAIKLNADIYHFHDPELAPWMLILKLTGKKVIFDIHENIIGSLTDRRWIPPLLRQFVISSTKIFLPLLIKNFDVIYAEHSYPDIYPKCKNHEVICNFPTTKFFPSSAHNKFETFSLIYIGSITKERGLIDMLDALSILKKRSLNVELYLIGKINLPKDDKIDDLITQRNLNDSIHTLGYIPQPEALKIASKCHLGLAILHPVKNYLLSYPTKIFEYMGCGIPFITSNFPLYKKVIDKWHCGFTIEPQNPIALANLIEDISQHPQKVEDMGNQGKQAVKNEYNWSFEEDRLVSFYSKVLSG